MSCINLSFDKFQNQTKRFDNLFVIEFLINLVNIALHQGIADTQKHYYFFWWQKCNAKEASYRGYYRIG